METALFMWSSSKFADVDVVDPAPLSLQPPALSIPKQTKRRASSATKIPQRGLGVAQLERIRLEGSAGSVDEPGAGGGVYSFHPLACRLGAPVGYGSGSSSAIRSALQEQYSADRVRIGGPGGSPLLLPAELPSKQRATAATTPVCHCEHCIRRRVFGENLGFHGSADADAYFPTTIHPQEERKERFMREIKEYEFFPRNSGGGDLMLGDRTAAGVASSVDDGSFLDLSLRL